MGPGFGFEALWMIDHYFKQVKSFVNLSTRPTYFQHMYLVTFNNNLIDDLDMGKNTS